MKSVTPSPHDVGLRVLVELLRGRRIVALAGAGCSTESGIPDYRGPESIKRVRHPIQYQEFVRSETARVRYWSRSMIGWPRIRAARPNQGHRALARLEDAGLLRGVITQNVDGLHQAAGSHQVVELHGTLAMVRCLACGQRVARADFQDTLRKRNAKWVTRYTVRSGPGDAEAAPDGDAELPREAMERFVVPSCERCEGVLKPDVVFFGENVPTETVAQAWSLFEQAEVLLVIGSSLTVYSGRRFIYRAEKDNLPIAIVNVGPTRADELAAVKIDGQLGEVLPRVVRELVEAPSGSAPPSPAAPGRRASDVLNLPAGG